MIKRAMHLTYRSARRIVVAIVGVSVTLLGVVMIVTPGPAVVVIPAGLAILAIEFVWARRWLRRLRETISQRARDARVDRADQHRQGRRD